MSYDNHFYEPRFDLIVHLLLFVQCWLLVGKARNLIEYKKGFHLICFSELALLYRTIINSFTVLIINNEINQIHKYINFLISNIILTSLQISHSVVFFRAIKNNISCYIHLHMYMNR